ncbi:hypothetical protein CLIB1444_07S06678 [[Candida] jaroonii]|uniref:Uncharacterized protein n=1 Tax=[Candida] jaroonii TaxID=467808 RepID=A0ACA9YAZ9_9ASCO|nr:hypothetical protein CLIB1444_07S06678 [[Candida] jaroonii]
MNCVEQITAVERFETFDDYSIPFEECVMEVFRLLFKNKSKLREFLKGKTFLGDRFTKRINRLFENFRRAAEGTDLLDEFQENIDIMLAFISGNLTMRKSTGPANQPIILFEMEREGDLESWYSPFWEIEEDD